MVTPSSYRPQALDTSVETDGFEFALLRQRSNSDRLQMSIALTKGAKELCLCGIRQTYASRSEQDITQAIVRAFLGDHCPPGFISTGTPMTWIQDSISLAIQLYRRYSP